MNCGHYIIPETLPVANENYGDPFVESDRSFLSQDSSLPWTAPYQEAPIDNLPPEILAAIFSFTQTYRISSTVASLKWIHCAQVSRRWRRVSLTFPSLWACIDPSWRIAETFIRRSKHSPLTLRMHIKTYSSLLESQIMSSAFKYMYRTRELHLRLDGAEALGNIAFPLRQSGLKTLLETLEVHCEEPFILPKGKFLETCGNMQSLNLTNAILPYPHGLLRNTRHLESTS